MEGHSGNMARNTSLRNAGIAWDFTKFEKDFHDLLSLFRVAATIEIYGDERVYSTKYVILRVEGCPIIKKATAVIAPINDEKGNKESIGIITAFVGTACNQPFPDYERVGKFPEVFTKALKSRKNTRFETGYFRITIRPPDRKEAIALIAMEIEPLKAAL